MGKLVITHNTAVFRSKHEQFKDMVLGHMALDIERFIKMSAGTPVKTGNMKSMVRHFRWSNGTSTGVRVKAEAEYSAVQEQGRRMSGRGAPTREFKNYTTPGTSAGWFGRSIMAILKNKDKYIREAARAVGL